MDRFWFLTSTTYGTWLPGDARGSVTRVRESEGPLIERDRPGTPYIDGATGLETSASSQLRGAPIFFDREQAEVIAAQFLETAAYRGWSILALAILSNHFHMLVGVAGDPEPSDLLRDFKSWAGRRLNEKWGRPPSETWWTAKGSVRKKSDWPAVSNAVGYVRRQVDPLYILIDDALVEEARRILEDQARGGRQPIE